MGIDWVVFLFETVLVQANFPTFERSYAKHDCSSSLSIDIYVLPQFCRDTILIFRCLVKKINNGRSFMHHGYYVLRCC